MGWFSSFVGGVVGFLVGGPVGAVIGAGIGATKVGEKAVNAVMDFVLQPFMPNIDMPTGEAAAQREQGVLIQRQGSTNAIPVIYGYRKVAGAVSFAETGSSNNKYLYVAYVFSEGVIEGLREVYIDDWLLPVDQVGQLNAGQLVTVNSDRYKDRVQLRFYPGVYFSNPRNSTVGSTVKGDIFADAPSFTNEMVYNGLCVLFARYEWREIKTQADADSNPFSGSIPDVQVALLGKRVTSLLTNDAENSSYDTLQNNTALTRYSTNPAEILLDYLRNPRYGKGLENTDIDFTSFKIAARKCNQTVAYLSSTSAITGPILTLNMVVNTDSSIMTNVKTMLQNSRGYMPYVQGKYKLKIEDAGNDTDILSGAATIVQTFTKDDIVSDVTYMGIDRSSKYNVVSVTYVDPDQKFSNQTVVYPETEAERQIYIDRDGGRENKYDVTLGGITNYAIAKDFARLIFNKQRRQESCVFTATSKALELEPGDCIRIQSNLLNFGTDPWRIISLKVNNDMTVDLGCVRNPDDIYPYTRVGEEDVVLPTYIPKGSIIYFPSSDNQSPLGLVPPTYAVFPPSTTPIVTNPAPTNPDGVGGGGVGGGSPGGETAGPITATPTTPTPPSNVTPVAPPPPPPFAAALKLKSSRAVSLGTGNFNFNLVFTQPADGLYSYSIVWWRYNRFSPWTEVRLDTLPGAGGDIPWTLNNLGYGQYDYYVRSFATDGRSSNQVLVGQIAFPQNVADLNPSLSGIATAQQTQVSEGWILPASQVAAQPRYDDNIDFIEIRPKLNAGVPYATRRMRVVLNQNTNTYANTPNLLISGVRVYYRYTTDTFYNYEDYKFSTVSNYAPGAQVSFDLAGDFGASGAGLTNYTFVVRLLYVDGTTAQKQMGPATANIEQFIGLYDFVALGTGSTVAARITSQAIPAGFSLKTVDEDPNKAYASGAAIIPNIRDIRANNTLPVLQWQFNPPTNTKWRGYKIRYRPVVPGTNQAFTELDTGFALNTTSGFLDYTINGGAFKLNTFYDWVVTAQYYDTATATVKDATTSMVCRASITAGLGTQYNVAPGILNTIMAFTQQETTTALNTLRTTFPALPTPDPKSWIKRQAQAYDPAKIGRLQLSGAYGSQADVARAAAGTSFNLATYYEFKFQMPNDTFDQLIIYRRVFSKTGDARTSVGTTAKYYELGVWEKIAINRALITKGSDGLYTVYVRGPISPDAFDINYQRTGYGTSTLLKRQYGAGSYPDAATTGKLTGVYPYYGAGNTDWASGTPTRWCEFLFSIRDAGVDSTKALRLRDFYATSSGTAFQPNVDGFLTGNVSKLDIVTLSDFNGYEAGYQRNLNEAITTYVNSQYLQFGIQETNGSAFFNPNYVKTPNSTQFGIAPNIFIIAPVNGDPVY